VIINLYYSPAKVLSSAQTLKKADFVDISEVWDVNQSLFYFVNNRWDTENKHGIIFFEENRNFIRN